MTPVLGISVLSAPDDRRSCLYLGCTKYIQKGNGFLLMSILIIVQGTSTTPYDEQTEGEESLPSGFPFVLLRNYRFLKKIVEIFQAKNTERNFVLNVKE